MENLEVLHLIILFTMFIILQGLVKTAFITECKSARDLPMIKKTVCKNNLVCFENFPTGIFSNFLARVIKKILSICRIPLETFVFLMSKWKNLMLFYAAGIQLYISFTPVVYLTCLPKSLTYRVLHLNADKIDVFICVSWSWGEGESPFLVLISQYGHTQKCDVSITKIMRIINVFNLLVIKIISRVLAFTCSVHM